MKKVIILVLAVVMSFVIGCGSSNTPSAVAKAYYQNMADGKANDAFELLTQESKEELTAMMGDASAVSEMMQKTLKKQKGLKSLEILSEEITGETAVVKIKINYGNGKSDEQTQNLIKEDGMWLIGSK